MTEYVMKELKEKIDKVHDIVIVMKSDLDMTKKEVLKTNGRVTRNEQLLASYDKNSALILHGVEGLKEIVSNHLNDFNQHRIDDKEAQDKSEKNDHAQEAKLNKLGGALIVINILVTPILIALLLKYLNL